ncbi:diguanylate cyclase [Salmonella enterica subsp. enterica serovar Heidelberg]|nr:diguanylate cyclase [Salmonella enterica]ECD3552552.1 diguanylate cyclase [Salmonella enterica subsp. enterica serovar Heidelberg]ECX5367100.1 diguanylate cyclase [Salmonella enterica]EED6880253.1 diguanylate cyclase [Salmonella enterica subsp. enterica serovar Heidelberg]HCL1828147.1 diguanylate cyclase [Salmonella enterica subsp. enterica serovar Heidelberg]
MVAQGTLLKERINPPHLASSPTCHSYLNSELLKSEPIVNLSTAQLIGYEVLTQLPSEHDSEVFFQQLMLMEGIETSEQRSIAFYAGATMEQGYLWPAILPDIY